MIINDCVLDLENSMDLEPAAATWLDRSRYRTDGACEAAGQPNWVQLPSGLWVMDFNGATTDWVEGTWPQCNFTSEDFSIIARTRLETMTTDHHIFCRGANVTDGYWFRFLATGGLAVYTNQAAASQISTTLGGLITPDVFYTVGISRSGNSVRIYIDGIDRTNTVGVHIDPLTSARTAKIGVYDNKSYAPMDGIISSLKVFNYALTPGQHRNWHNKIAYLYGGV